MLDEKIIEQHQLQLKFHRILFGLLIAILFIVYCGDTKEFNLAFTWLFVGSIVLTILEFILSKLVFLNRIYILRGFTYIQYIFYVILFFSVYDINVFVALGCIAFLLTFMFEYSYYSDITDNLMNVQSVVLLTLPALLMEIFRFFSNGVAIYSFLVFLVYCMLCTFDIMIVRLYYVNKRQFTEQNNILLSEIESMKDSNDELTDFKNRIQKVNEELNLQKIKLTQMNKEINQYNSELSVQSEILKFINSSFSSDAIDVMKYTIDVIIRVRHVEFCGIYIDKKVFNSKHGECCFRSVSNPDLSDVPELKTLYKHLNLKEDERQILHSFPKDEFPGISQTKVAALLILPLISDGEKYGIIVSGIAKANGFDNYSTFYDTIVPQFNLAIHNIKMFAQMKHIAQTDGLTGINNRTHFNKLFAEQLERTIQNHEPLTVALFDIDKFKRINDTYGHLVGDEVIKAIAHMAAKKIEETEYGFICRYGGEEFVMAFPNMSLEQAIPIIQDLHHEIATTTVDAYDKVVSMNVSIGVSSYPDICDDVNQLIKRADWAMYYAKEHGRGQIKVDGPDVEKE